MIWCKSQIGRNYTYVWFLVGRLGILRFELRSFVTPLKSLKYDKTYTASRTDDYIQTTTNQSQIFHKFVGPNFVLSDLPQINRRIQNLYFKIHLNYKTNFQFLSRRKGTVVAQWLRSCATNRKVASSIPDGVTGIFLWHNPSDRTMRYRLQPLTEMITRVISWG